MINDTTKGKLLPHLFELLEAHRSVFKQGRPFRRAVGLVLGDLFSFGRHTVTQELLSLGITEGDWSAWYRLFSRERFAEEKLSACLLGETVQHVGQDELYCAAMDSMAIHRSSLKMPGTSWLSDNRFSAFRPGTHRAQRFLHGTWLTPLDAGYSRAIPLRFLPAFPPPKRSQRKCLPVANGKQVSSSSNGCGVDWVRPDVRNGRS